MADSFCSEGWIWINLISSKFDQLPPDEEFAQDRQTLWYCCETQLAAVALFIGQQPKGSSSCYTEISNKASKKVYLRQTVEIRAKLFNYPPTFLLVAIPFVALSPSCLTWPVTEAIEFRSRSDIIFIMYCTLRRTQDQDKRCNVPLNYLSKCLAVMFNHSIWHWIIF